MLMQKIQLPNYPTDIPDDSEVRDFALPGGRYARVCMTLARELQNNVAHFILYAQAFEMNADGSFAPARGGFPSRTNETGHSIIATAYNKAIKLDDAWVEVFEEFNPMYPGNVEIVQERPTDPADYETRVWVQPESKMLKYAEGFADIVARTKVVDLIELIEASDVHSGVAFRNLRQNQGVV